MRLFGDIWAQFRGQVGYNFEAIICSKYLGEFYPRGDGYELKSCKPWSLTGYYCIQMECVTLDRNANITCSIARMWANTARCSTMNGTHHNVWCWIQLQCNCREEQQAESDRPSVKCRSPQCLATHKLDWGLGFDDFFGKSVLWNETELKGIFISQVSLTSMLGNTIEDWALPNF